MNSNYNTYINTIMYSFCRNNQTYAIDIYIIIRNVWLKCSVKTYNTIEGL